MGTASESIQRKRSKSRKPSKSKGGTFVARGVRSGSESDGQQLKPRRDVDLDTIPFKMMAEEIVEKECEFVVRDKSGNLFLVSLLAKPVRFFNGRPVYRYEDAEKIGAPPP
jgi:hypothetical protein